MIKIDDKAIDEMYNGDLRAHIAKARGWKWITRVLSEEDGTNYEIRGWSRSMDILVLQHLPDWPGEMSDAWSLAEEAHMSVYTPGSCVAGGEYVTEDSYVAECFVEQKKSGQEEYSGDWHDHIRATANTVTTAICRCWLKWHYKIKDES